MAVETEVNYIALEHQIISSDNLECFAIKLPPLNTFCDDYNVSPIRLLQLIWSAVLSTYSGSNDVTFHFSAPTPVGSKHTWDEHVCRFNMSQTMPILDLLKEEPQSWNGGGGAIEGCDTLLLWKQTFAEFSSLSKNYTSNIKIILVCEENFNGINAAMHFSSSKVGKLEARGMAAAVGTAAMAIVGRRCTILGDINMCGEHDLGLLCDWNNVEQVWRDNCVHELIARWSAESPGRLAVSAWDGDLSYGDLDRLSTTLAIHLIDLGIKPDQFVGICFEKSKWLVISILGIVKAGGAYAVLEPAYTVARMRSICKELEIGLIVASDALNPTAISLPARIVTLGEKWELSCESLSKPRHGDPATSALVQPHNALYVVFSSGSTGNPKGIIVEHAAFVSWGMATADSVCLDMDSRVLQFASFAFLVAHRDVLLTLMLGACICMPQEEDRLNHLEVFMTKHQVNWANLTPSVAALLNPTRVPDLKTLVFTGEPMSLSSLTVWAGKLDLIYAYGQAESVSISCVRKNPTLEEDRLNIGHRVGKAIWLVDPLDHEKLVPVGAVGELLVEGAAIARGYIDPERTAQSFLRDTSWLTKVRPPGYRTRLYKTGDLAQYCDDGSIRFLCRKDNAVKLHGQRVELDEVEHHVRGCLTDLSDWKVHDIVVDLASLEDNLNLTVFLGVAHTSPELNEDILLGPLDQATQYLKKLRSCLQLKNVPKLMIPTLLVPLSRIPLNPSGKTDRKRLRNIVSAMTREEATWCKGWSQSIVEVAQTSEELNLQRLWSRVLNILENTIDRNDNFFERGGNSIAAMRLAALAQDAKISLTFSDIFVHPTLSAQAQLVGNRTGDRLDYSNTPFGLVTEKYQEIVELSMSECDVLESQIQDIYPTTPMQAGLIALTTLQPGTYISQKVFEIQKGVSLPGLELAWKTVFDANPPLRTRIIQCPDGGTFQVVVHEQFGFKILDHNLEEYIRQDKSTPMEMGHQLARLAVLRENGLPHLCIFTMHHCVYDAWTVPLLLEQVNAAYHGAFLPQVPFSPFVDYVSRFNQDTMKYWADEFSALEADPFPPLPNVTQAYVPSVTCSEKLDFSIPLTDGNNGITLSNRITLAWALSVARYTASDDVVFGLTVSGRGAPVPGIDRITGPTIATIPLRMQLRSRVSIKHELQALQNRLVAMVPYEQYGLQNIKRLGEEAERACRFQSLLVIQQFSQEPDNTILRLSHVGNGTPFLQTFALTLLCLPSNDGKSIRMEALYDESVLSGDQIRRLLKLFAQLLTQVIVSPNQLIREVKAISPEDLEQLRLWNAEVPPSSLGIIHLIEQHVRKQPGAVAIDAWDGPISYAELDQWSSTFAVTLLDHGMQPETFVPLLFEKSKFVAVAMLAVIKAGGAFILLDASHPLQRLQIICEESQGPIVVCSDAQVDTAVQLGCQLVLPIRKLSPAIRQNSQLSKGNSAICAVFTSGSSGKPKGAILTHEGVATNAILAGTEFELNEDSRVFQFASHAFDVAVTDYLFTLAWGGSVCVPNESASRDDLANTICELDANWCFLTPSIARMIDPDAIPKLKSLVLGGEAPKQVDVERWAERLQLVLVYGPAECTVYTTVRRITDKRSTATSSGKAVAGCCWIVSPDNPDQLAPIGSIGEVLIEGPIVGRGYIGHAKSLKASPFIKFPDWLSSFRGGKQTGKLYKTGDLAQYSGIGDGSLEIIGRKDQQVKLRGQRIEFGEIEYQLGQIISTPENILVDIITPSTLKTPTLVAFIRDRQIPTEEKNGANLLPAPDAKFFSKVIKAKWALGKILPRHMVPTLFIPLGYLPFTATGKANRRLLKEKASLLTQQELDAYRSTGKRVKRLPSNKVEQIIQRLVSESLHLEIGEIGMDDNFFHLGGDSIRAMAIASQAQREGLNIGMADILDNPQLSAMSDVIVNAFSFACGGKKDEDSLGVGLEQFSMISSREDYKEIVRAAMEQCGFEKEQIEDIYPCTPMQEGLFALTMHQPEAYVWRLVLELQENINLARFQDAWESVYQANPILRTRIISIDLGSKLFQVVSRSRTQWSSSDLLTICPGKSLLNIEILYPEKSEDHVRPQVRLMLHHSIYDDISIKSIIAQVGAAYNGATLQSMPYSPFVRFCVSLSTDENQKVLDFWKEELADTTSSVFPKVPASGYSLRDAQVLRHHFPFRFDSDVGKPLAALVHLVWGMVISQFTGEKDVVFGTVVSGRAAKLRNIERISGPTIATVPFRVSQRSSGTIQDAIAEVQAHRTRMVPFEQTGLQRIREIVQSEVCRFQNLLVILPPESDPAAPDTVFRKILYGAQRGNFDTYPLTLTFAPTASSVNVHAEYDDTLISKGLMQRILSHFAHVLTYLNANWTRPISEVPLISDSDLAQLQVWNESSPVVVSHNACVHELIQKTIDRSPKAPAVSAWDGDLSYRELDRFSSLLQNDLLHMALPPNSVVPIYLQPSKWTAVAVLAVMKAGCAFLLLDHGYPIQRLSEMCKSTTPSLILSSKGMKGRAASLAQVPIITVDGDPTAWERREIYVPNGITERIAVKPSDTMYVVFTSGTTGQPKGIVIPHLAFSSMAIAYSRSMGISPETRGLAFASYAFDVSITDMLDPLITGGCVCVPSSIDRSGNLPDAIARFRANFIEITPSMLRTFRPADVPSLKTVVVSGEPLNQDIIDIWATKVNLIQAYGPAECCPNSAVRTNLTETSDPSNIGVGAGCRLWVVDPSNHARLMPIGAIGELLIEGPNVGSGYLNNPEKTADSFIKAPSWATKRSGDTTPARFYKTGDLVQYDADGSLMFRGRKDTQVKIRGQRVEITEIEYHLSLLFPMSMGSAVEMFQPEATSSQELVGFIFCGEEIWKQANTTDPADLLAALGLPFQVKNVADIKAHLGENLPRYMIPTRYQIWAMKPTSMSAKLNRQRLQSELRNPTVTSTVLELRETLSAINRIDSSNTVAMRLGEKILSFITAKTRTGLIDRDFPLTILGLDSIQLIILVTFVRQEFGLKLAVGTLYDPRLTVTGLAALITDCQQNQQGGAEISLPALDILTEIQDVFHQFIQQSNVLHHRQRVFLTGATGLLGSQILRRLLDDPCVSQVIVHVRASSADSALKRVIATATLAKWWSPLYLDKIECVPGDLSAPRLGLHEHNWRILCNIDSRPEQQITSIIHNGAAVHWQAPYQHLKPVNVNSTVELLSALDKWERPGTFAFVSGGLQRSKSQDLESFLKTLESANGYSQTKFVAEELVSMYASRQSLHNMAILRPGLIIGTENEGIPNVGDFQWKLVQVCLRMGAYPMHDGDMWLSVADVDEVATALLKATLERTPDQITDTNVVDIETGTTVSRFWDLVQGTVGVKLNRLNPKQWREAAERFLSPDDLFRPLLAIMQDSGQGSGVQKPAGAQNIESSIINQNLRTLLDVGFISTVQESGGSDLPASKSTRNMAAFSRSRLS